MRCVPLGATSGHLLHPQIKNQVCIAEAYRLYALGCLRWNDCFCWNPWLHAVREKSARSRRQPAKAASVTHTRCSVEILHNSCNSTCMGDSELDKSPKSMSASYAPACPKVSPPCALAIMMLDVRRQPVIYLSLDLVPACCILPQASIAYVGCPAADFPLNALISSQVRTVMLDMLGCALHCRTEHNQQLSKAIWTSCCCEYWLIRYTMAHTSLVSCHESVCNSGSNAARLDAQLYWNSA